MTGDHQFVQRPTPIDCAKCGLPAGDDFHAVTTYLGTEYLESEPCCAPAAQRIDVERLARTLRRLGYRSLNTDEGYVIEAESAAAGISAEYSRLVAARS